MRPLKQITGDPEFNEIYFTDVRVPKDSMLGKPGEGWQVAMTTLLHERGTLGFALTAQLEQILQQDPHNLDAALRLATAHSALGHDQQALAAFARAQAIAPDSPDVRTYLALHNVQMMRWAEDLRTRVTQSR